MKYYFISYQSITGSLIKSAVIDIHPFIWRARVNQINSNADVLNVRTLIYFIEITKDEYDLFRGKKAEEVAEEV